MADENLFQMTQGYDVIPPRRGRAYPILCEEWEHLKTQVGLIRTSFALYHTLGSLLLGAGVSTLISIIAGAYSVAGAENSSAIVTAWAVTIVCILIGAVCMFFARESQSLSQVQAVEIVRQMNLIEKRYPADGG